MSATLLGRSTLLCIAALWIAACGVTAAPPAPAPVVAKANITLAGSGGGTTILKHLVAPFQSESAAVTLEFLQGSSSGGAKQAVADGTLDVAILLSANIEGEQKEGIELLPLAEDPVAFVVHADLPIESLTAEQIKGIYLGEITSWRDVGGPDAPIVVLTRDEDEGTTKILRKMLFNDAAWAESAIVFTKASELNAAVQKTPNSIGFGSFGGFVIGGLGEQVIAVDGAAPTDAAAYAIPPRTLAIAYQPGDQAQIQPLIDYLKGESARAAMLSAGVVPQP